MTRTRIVRWLRILLPLLALVILSTLFLFSPGSDTQSHIPYAQVDPADGVPGPRVIAPEYAGVTGDGAELTLRATGATPAGDDGAGSARDVQLDWRRIDGLHADLAAAAADMDDGAITLRGDVQMTTSTGWVIGAPMIAAATDRSHLAATDGVTAEAPFGRLTAGRMDLQAGKEQTPAAILNFSGGVRLLYLP